MENTTQLENLKKALELEKFIRDKRIECKDLRLEEFTDIPEEPVHKTIEKTYPEVVSTLKFKKRIAFLPLLLSWVFTFAGIIPGLGFLMALGGIIWPLSIIWIPVYYFGIKIMKKKEIETKLNSAEYKQQCADIDRKVANMQAEENKRYQQAKEDYETKLLPKYHKDLSEWTNRQNQKIEEAEILLENAEKELENHYNTSKVIPLQYRKIDALEYIYKMVSSSDFDIKQAIENYDKKVQRDLDKAKIEEQQVANQLAYEANRLADEQAQLLSEQNYIAEKARRDANVASAIGIVQRHSINKKLKR